MSTNIFNKIKLTKEKSNHFDLTHDVKMSGVMGNLMPCCIMEAVPGDKFDLGSEVFLRFAPMIAPVMHRLDVYVHYFFVPNRITWSNWENFITNEPTGGLPTVYVDQTLTDTEKKFLDYMGIPPCPPSGQGRDINALPLAAYQAIYNEYYRDENNIPTEVNYKLTDGDNTSNTDLVTMRKRAWEHDYFTSCLPWAQKGAAVDIPLGDVYLDDDGASEPIFRDRNGNIQGGNVTQQAPPLNSGVNVGGSQFNAYDPDGTLKVGATTINELRRAFRLQEWLEKNARGGTRYIEQILTHFGVRSSDSRLQRPEYIYGSKTPVVISEVLNTTGEQSGLPQGNMAGHGVSVGGNNSGKYYSEEHGYIIGIISVLPKTAYQQGIPRNWLKTDPLEFFWPSFAHIGEQEVYNDELYAYDPITTGGTFGYIPRYAEYKYMPSRVAGDFRSSLDYWHCGRIFANAPTLNQEFIECENTDVNRIFAVTEGDIDTLYIQVLNKVHAKRLMPVFGTPYL